MYQGKWLGKTEGFTQTLRTSGPQLEGKGNLRPAVNFLLWFLKTSLILCPCWFLWETESLSLGETAGGDIEHPLISKTLDNGDTQSVFMIAICLIPSRLIPIHSNSKIKGYIHEMFTWGKRKVLSSKSGQEDLPWECTHQSFAPVQHFSTSWKQQILSLLYERLNLCSFVWISFIQPDPIDVYLDVSLPEINGAYPQGTMYRLEF